MQSGRHRVVSVTRAADAPLDVARPPDASRRCPVRRAKDTGKLPPSIVQPDFAGPALGMPGGKVIARIVEGDQNFVGLSWFEWLIESVS